MNNATLIYCVPGVPTISCRISAYNFNPNENTRVYWYACYLLVTHWCSFIHNFPECDFLSNWKLIQDLFNEVNLEKEQCRIRKVWHIWPRLRLTQGESYLRLLVIYKISTTACFRWFLRRQLFESGRRGKFDLSRWPTYHKFLWYQIYALLRNYAPIQSSATSKKLELRIRRKLVFG